METAERDRPQVLVRGAGGATAPAPARTRPASAAAGVVQARRLPLKVSATLRPGVSSVDTMRSNPIAGATPTSIALATVAPASIQARRSPAELSATARPGLASVDNIRPHPIADGTPSSMTLATVAPSSTQARRSPPELFAKADVTANRQIAKTPQPPSGLAVADLADCAYSQIIDAAGRSTYNCRALLNDGKVVLRWKPADCTEAAACGVEGYRVHEYRTDAQVAEVGEGRNAVLVPGAKLGDCYVVRAYNFLKESRNSNARCVTVMRTTQRLTLGPSEIGQFQAMVHDNVDHGYCTRRSWSKTWASEPWGFIVHTSSVKLNPNNPVDGMRMTVGWLGITDPGTKPFPCEEGLMHVWRGYLVFTVPSEARQANANVVFAFTPVGDGRATGTCFHYLWRANRWVYRQEQGYSPTIGINDGRMLDHDKNPLGLLVLAAGRASFDLSNDQAFRNSGQIALELAAFHDGLNTDEIAHPSLHRGLYMPPSGNATCGANNPHLEITYPRTQSTTAPYIPPDVHYLELNRSRP